MLGVEKLYPEDFPPPLREIPDPPAQLYMRGKIPQGYKFLTVVGSRAVSQYGKDACEHLIAGLEGYPIAIVSGLALGTDAIAHRAALRYNLPTIAVPGSGINDAVLYPRTNIGLAYDILDAGGALMSEFEPDEKTMIHFFPQRNRIMAGMSDAVLIIEAGLQSGTLITARLATDYNRELLCVPHSIFAEGGAGGHQFMKLGAAPARSAGDILEALGIVEEKNIETVQLTSEEQEVLSLLSEPLTRDELVRAIGAPIGQINVLLAQMELRGLLAESLGQIRKLI